MLRILIVLTTSVLAFGTNLAFGANVPKPAAPNDAVIESAIRAKFAKSKINEEHFKVTVKSGVALLEGKTSVPQRKGVATRLAKTGGAKGVVNKIEVSEAARKQMADRLQKAREKKAAKPRPPAVTKPAPTPAPTVVPKVPAATSVATATPDPAPMRRMQIKR